MIKKKGTYEVRLRVTIFLPVGNPNEHRAMLAVTRYLKEQGASYTRSASPEAVFVGAWWDDKKDKWVPERVALFIIDYEQLPEDPERSLFDQALGQLEKAIKDQYRRYKKPQKVVWIITQQATRYG